MADAEQAAALAHARQPGHRPFEALWLQARYAALPRPAAAADASPAAAALLADVQGFQQRFPNDPDTLRVEVALLARVRGTAAAADRVKAALGRRAVAAADALLQLLAVDRAEHLGVAAAVEAAVAKSRRRRLAAGPAAGRRTARPGQGGRRLGRPPDRRAAAAGAGHDPTGCWPSPATRTARLPTAARHWPPSPTASPTTRPSRPASFRRPAFGGTASFGGGRSTASGRSPARTEPSGRSSGPSGCWPRTQGRPSGRRPSTGSARSPSGTAGCSTPGGCSAGPCSPTASTRGPSTSCRPPPRPPRPRAGRPRPVRRPPVGQADRRGRRRPQPPVGQPGAAADQRQRVAEFYEEMGYAEAAVKTLLVLPAGGPREARLGRLYRALGRAADAESAFKRVLNDDGVGPQDFTPGPTISPPPAGPRSPSCSWTGCGRWASRRP